MNSKRIGFLIESLMTSKGSTSKGGPLLEMRNLQTAKGGTLILRRPESGIHSIPIGKHTC